MSTSENKKKQPAPVGEILDLDTIRGQLKNIEVMGAPDTANELFRVSVIATSNDSVGRDAIERILQNTEGSFTTEGSRYDGITSQYLKEEPGTTVLFVPKDN